MTPEQIMAMKAAADIIKTLGALPLGTLALLAILGPWAIMFLISWNQNRRFEGVVEMYKSNVELVKDYKDLVDGYKKIVEGQQDLIIHTTQTLTTIKEIADNNLYCPMVRKETKPTKEIHG